MKPAAGYRSLAYSSPEAVQSTGTVAIIGLYNGVLAKHQRPDSCRAELLLAFHDLRTEGLNEVERVVEAGDVAGDIAKNREELAELRQDDGRLLAKIEALTEDQARQIRDAAIGFWEGQEAA